MIKKEDQESYDRWIRFNNETKVSGASLPEGHKVQACEQGIHTQSERSDRSVVDLVCVACIKCGSNKLAKTRQQVRSADEGMTTFYHCLSCRHVFSF